MIREESAAVQGNTPAGEDLLIIVKPKPWLTETAREAYLPTPAPSDSPTPIRIDKWLWCARFFKSRSQATDAVAGGLVHVNDERVKPSRLVQLEDRIRITKDEMRIEIIVQGFPQRRGPAPEARSHYMETPESIAARETRRELSRLSGPAPDGRPDKHGRRAIRELKNR